ncbi:unnamed protein product [Ceutorhynchus assimilis]|uniref:Ankyrin-3 n=1 Tax=Ceutorhynchus assimilis TaxID=467358 RepID=A0A9N9M9K5_9CUCU|nr:unnamed protein product [Ceutorhynchus assimilis]
MLKLKVHSDLIFAVREGRLEISRHIIDSVGLSYSPSWANGYVLLVEALMRNHAAIIAKLLLSEGAKVNSGNSEICPADTLLHLAVIIGDIEIVEMILNEGAKINAKNQCGETPLYFAIAYRKMEITELLLTRGADAAIKKKGYLKVVEDILQYDIEINMLHNSTKEGSTPLHNAAKNEQKEIAKLLISYGAKINTQDETGKTPIFYATKNADLNMIKLLLTNGAIVKDDPELLYIAVRKEYKEIVEALLQHDADINACDNYGRTALHFTASEIVTSLLSRGASVDVKGESYCFESSMTPLHICASKAKKNFNIHIAKDLLNYDGASINSLTSKGYTPLYFASKRGIVEAVKLFLDWGADINASTKDNLSPLHVAIENGHKTVIKLLLECGAIVYNQDTDRSVLQLAVGIGSLLIVEEVLKYCPDINNATNRNSLEIAVRGCRERDFSFNNKEPDSNVKGEIAKLLLSKGAHVDVQTEYGKTTLLSSTKKGYAKVVEVLLEYNANVNLALKSGFTPLHISAQDGNLEISTMILNKGANVNAAGKNGITALHLAAKNGHAGVVKLLLECNAKFDSEFQFHNAPLLLVVCVKGFCIALQLNIILINNTEIVTSLLSRGASVDVKGESYYFESSMTPLHICASKAKKNFNIHIAKDLLNYDGASINSLTSKGYTPLYFASKRGIVEAVKLFLDWGADINASTKDNLSPLHVAIENGHKTVIKLLLECGTIVYNQDTDRSALHFAVEIGSLLIVEEVLKYCPDVNNANFSFNNKEPDSNVKGEIAKLLLSKGAHVDVQTEYGKTTLLSSTKKGYAKVVEVLLEYNANVNLSLKSGFTPLHISAQEGNLEISTMILNKGANVNAAGKNGITALHLAAQNGHAGVVKLLLECNAKFDSEFQFHNAPLLLGGLTPLHNTAKKKQEEIAKLLISYGAKLNTQDETGKTPIFYATKNVDLKMIELLLTNGAIVEDDPELLYIAVRKEYKEIVEALLQHDADINACDNYGRTALHFTASDQHE